MTAEQKYAEEIKMASALGYETVAEGIEIEKQYRFLELEGCDVIQGYFAGKPMLPEDLDVWVRNYSHPSRPRVEQNMHNAAWSLFGECSVCGKKPEEECKMPDIKPA